MVAHGKSVLRPVIVKCQIVVCSTPLVIATSVCIAKMIKAHVKFWPIGLIARVMIAVPGMRHLMVVCAKTMANVHCKSAVLLQLII